MPDPLLVGRDPRKLEALADAHRHRPLDPRSRRGAGRPAIRGVLRRRLDPAARRAAAARDRRPQARLLREADRRPPRGRARRLARRRGRRHPPRRGAGQALAAGAAEAQDADRRRLLRPHPRRQGRLRLLGVRGRLAGRPAPVLELQEGRGRRHHPRHAVPLALRARQPVRRGQKRLLPRRQPHPGAGGRAGRALRGRCRRCGLRHLRARGRHRRPDQQLLVHARAPGRSGGVPGRRHPRLGARGAHPVLGPAAGRDAAPGLEPGRRPHAGFPRRLAGGAGQPEPTTTRSRPSGSCSCATSRARLPDFRWNLLEGAKGVQLAELGYRSWAERRMLEVPPLEA